MNKEESLALYKKGREVWNTWAEEMLAQQVKLIETGEWMVEDRFLRQRRRETNRAMRNWFAVARSDFSKHNFDNEGDFTNFEFPGVVDFTEAKFSGRARFMETKFCGHATFGKASFGGDAEFLEAMFGNHNARFWGATFRGNALFGGATFGGDTDFWRATFDGDALFREAKFSGTTQFQEAAFGGDALFREAKFSGDARFDQAIFESHASFSGTTFQKDVSFVAIRGQNFFTLEDAVFFLVPDFSQSHFAEAPRLDNSRFVYLKSRRWGGQRPASVNPDITARWRTLKRLAVQGHDHERELNFLAEEIKSLRGVQDFLLPNPLNLGKNKSVWSGGGRYWAGLFYQWFSDFGRSIVRPLLSWAIMTAAFAFYFHHLSPHSHLDSGNPLPTAYCSGNNPVTAALYLSVNNGLVISGLGHTEKLAQSYACLYGTDGKDRIPPIMPDAVIFAGIVQTILSAVLIFLFLLALRNYFRIK